MIECPRGIFVRYYTLAQMKRVDRDYPHPEGSIEAGWYWRERPGAPVGPFKSEREAIENAIAEFNKERK